MKSFIHCAVCPRRKHLRLSYLCSLGPSATLCSTGLLNIPCWQWVFKWDDALLSVNQTGLPQTLLLLLQTCLLIYRGISAILLHHNSLFLWNIWIPLWETLWWVWRNSLSCSIHSLLRSLFLCHMKGTPRA